MRAVPIAPVESMVADSCQLGAAGSRQFWIQEWRRWFSPVERVSGAGRMGQSLAAPRARLVHGVVCGVPDRVASIPRPSLPRDARPAWFMAREPGAHGECATGQQMPLHIRERMLHFLGRWGAVLIREWTRMGLVPWVVFGVLRALRGSET